VAAVFLLVAIGLGIWGLSTKSDLDDAQATISEQQRELAAGRQRAAEQEASEKAFGERAERAYRAVRARLISARREESDLKGQIDQETAQLQQARRQVAAADNATARADAQLKQANEETDVAAACARGTVDAVNRFFDATSARAGANAALRRLEDLQPKCEAAVR
jgi:chromosome segregation ATPase